MTSSSPVQSPLLPPPIVWWALWFAMTSGVVALRALIGVNASTDAGVLGLVAVGPLVVSAVIRFVLLPRFSTPVKAFPFFVVGVAAAEACGILGLFLGGKNADAFIGLSLVALFFYLPLFVLRRFAGAAANPFRAG